ncbi:hypothetical protein ACFY2T_07340 [Streptomyces sp. NPDC001260]|uniref:Uncharacterized protein n=1 Tax=Streptomyces gilvifuscus TaxID=1550617 RepID=A0ABT5G0F3_9ACTN|nr:hypothetical protein [Streptomyces gilvifuscus]MDC2958273.1 hypothetical protein [Streptomyces gilvifuscus]
MSDGRTAAGSEPALGAESEDGEAWSSGYEWVTNCTVDGFVGRVQAMREGDEPGTEGGVGPRPAAAVRALHAFAVRRSVDELISSAARFHDRDAVTVLATAALYRNILQAAELAIKQWDVEHEPGGAADGGPRLIDGVIHDIACQRTVLDVAVFVRRCRDAGRHEMVDRTVRVFTTPSSGRTNLDKALLYVALRDEKCVEEAAELLRLSLVAITENGAQTPDTVPRQFHDLAGALHHVSPSERILEEWADAQLQLDDDFVHETRQIIAQLIATRTDGRDTLVEHVGKRRTRHDIAEICGRLSRPPHAAKCAEIRRHAAARDKTEDLAEIVRTWYESDALKGTTEDLLADIVARGAARDAGPRSLRELDRLDTALSNVNAPPECRRMLRVAAAVHTDGRTGAELVALLGKVERPRDRNRAARTVARRLAARVLANSAEADLFVEYVHGLRGAGRTEAVYLACKELADPSDPVPAPEGSGAVVARIAARLYDADLRRDGRDPRRDGWDLLERCLENEQRITPQEVAVVVAQLRRSAMNEEDRHFLLRATVGRWSDARRREEAVAELSEKGFDAEAREVIRSLR